MSFLTEENKPGSKRSDSQVRTAFREISQKYFEDEQNFLNCSKNSGPVERADSVTMTP